MISSLNGHTPTMEAKTEDLLPSPRNGKLVKLARVDEESDAFAASILRACGGDALQVFAFKNCKCAIMTHISAVFEIRATSVLPNALISCPEGFKQVGVFQVEENNILRRIYQQLAIRATPKSSTFWSRQSLVFLLAGNKSVAGDIVRHELKIDKTSYKNLFELAGIQTSEKPVTRNRSNILLYPASSIGSTPKSSQSDSAVLLQGEIERLKEEQRQIDRKIAGLEYALKIIQDG